MAQRISRAKRTIRDSGVPFALPVPVERAERFGSVVHVLHLIFNEGCRTSGSPNLIRAELATEAIRFFRAAADGTTCLPERHYVPTKAARLREP